MASLFCLFLFLANYTYQVNTEERRKIYLPEIQFVRSKHMLELCTVHYHQRRKRAGNRGSESG